MVLDLIFGFLLPLTPVVAVFIFSVIVLVIINVFYKILINQKAAKEVKDRTKSLQNEYKKEQKAGNTEKANKLMTEALKEQGKLMRMSMKPMIVSLIIVALLLPWVHGVYGDKTADGKFTYAGKEIPVALEGSKVTIEGASCDAPCTLETQSGLFEVSVNSGKAQIAPVVARLPASLPFLGNSIGWLGWYIIVSLPLAIITRKLMKINI